MLNKRIIIGVLTAAKYESRRKVCRDTWIANMQKYADIKVVFLIGGYQGKQPYHLSGDTLYLKCPDDYKSLPQKTAYFCRWALLETDCEYVFKCDDDTYIVADRFAAYKQHGLDYIGVDPVDHINPSFASGGAGYFLSRKAANIVATYLTATEGAEDLLTGQLLVKNNIIFTNEKRLQAWKLAGRIPGPHNDFITGHYLREDDMLSIHQEFQNTSQIHPSTF